MKKFFILFITFMLLNCVSVDAECLMIEVKEADGGRVIQYIDDNKIISFREAYAKYNVDNYVSIQYNDEIVYFYQGGEIDEATYLNGVSEEKTNNILNQYGDYGYRVKNTEELINTIKKLYDTRVSGVYHLVYSASDLANIDFKLVEDYVNDNYVLNSNINTFSYLNHAVINYPKYMFDYDDTEMVINLSVIISQEQEEYVNDFLDIFIKDLENKTPYEKILFTYEYLKNTVSSCDGKTVKGNSAYDALIIRNASCIGVSNAFQLIMERLENDAYIVDDISVLDDTIISNHTFNVVLLDGEYYIIDLSKKDYEGFLVGNTNNYKLSNGIDISSSSYNYQILNINIDYNKYDKLIKSILVEKKKDDILTQKKDDLQSIDFFSYIVLITILLFLTMVIIFFTRKDR